ncbi:LPS translocon maturation chaperone LptM [Methylogaea oryzae]|uniref:LPS translocon maturation chaperone LptM n=1 Tax=Methylogaea oryzae TaxID=1295382 RepID=UPI0006CFA5F4|nr:lipoprotein [Methylogaea oryzae]
MKYSLILALLALLSAGCGQKGPLYLPPPEPPAIRKTERTQNKATRPRSSKANPKRARAK